MASFVDSNSGCFVLPSLGFLSRNQLPRRAIPHLKSVSRGPSRPRAETSQSVYYPAMLQELSSVEKIDWLTKPILVKGDVQKGFGRGSKDLGCPTANLMGKLLDDVPEADRDGVYFGFGIVPKYGNRVLKMVANLGRNITYDDVKERVLEAYLMEDFKEDFYGEEMRLCIIGYLRPEWKFDSIDNLILHIKNDIRVSDDALDLPQAVPFQTNPFLTS